MSNLFNIRRCYQLLKIDVFLNKNLIMLVVASLLILMALMPVYWVSSIITFKVLLYAGGLLITSLALKDLHSNGQALLYLMLPCSHLEKFISKWFLSSLAYIVALLLLYYLYLATANMLIALYPNYLLITWPDGGDLLSTIMHYFSLHAIVFLGATIFKRHVLLKTLLLLGVLALVLKITIAMMSVNLIGLVQQLSAASILFWPAITLFCWGASYLLFVRKELV